MMVEISGGGRRLSFPLMPPSPRRSLSRNEGREVWQKSMASKPGPFQQPKKILQASLIKLPQMLNVWYIYLHLAWIYDTCR